MECKNCNSRWETGKSVSMPSGVCPFCGADLTAADDGAFERYASSKEALACIMRKYGAEVLLGSRLKSFFRDYAPDVKEDRRNVVFLVIETGAAEILKRKIGAEAAEQEIAYRQAVQRLIGKYPIERGKVEDIMLEFTAALGWKVSVQPQTPPEPFTELQRQTAPVLPKPVPLKLTPGQRNYQFGSYLWRVLDVRDGRALLLAEEVLELRRYHSERTSVTWRDCELRGYLNREFLWSFGSQEQDRIAQTENRNPDNPWYGTSGGGSTTDKVFLLSIEEVVKYFGDSGDLQARKGWYWDEENKKFILKDGKGYSIHDQYDGARIAKWGGNRHGWWLRSPGGSDRNAADVDCDGDLYMNGYNVNIEFGGVRPALWLNL